MKYPIFDYVFNLKNDNLRVQPNIWSIRHIKLLESTYKKVSKNIFKQPRLKTAYYFIANPGILVPPPLLKPSVSLPFSGLLPRGWAAVLRVPPPSDVGLRTGSRPRPAPLALS